jgi:hypothetical protein
VSDIKVSIADGKVVLRVEPVVYGGIPIDRVHVEGDTAGIDVVAELVRDLHAARAARVHRGRK